MVEIPRKVPYVVVIVTVGTVDDVVRDKHGAGCIGVARDAFDLLVGDEHDHVPRAETHERGHAPGGKERMEYRF